MKNLKAIRAAEACRNLPERGDSSSGSRGRLCPGGFLPPESAERIRTDGSGVPDSGSWGTAGEREEEGVFARALLAWYGRCRRKLRWREDPRPYYIWVSEIMLQQTRIETVKDYFDRFVEALPDTAALSACPEEKLMKLWEGLGYYSRARNLQKAARIVEERYGGKLPSERKELEALPGIGPYTAGAIASIAFGKAETAVDGNVIRVMSRILALEENTGLRQTKEKIGEETRRRLPADRPGDFNQAMMDVGATICLPSGAPLCGRCPLNSFCEAAARGNPQDYPKMPEKPPRKTEEKTIFLLLREGRIALVRGPEKGVLKGMWGLPSAGKRLSREEAAEWIARETGVPEEDLGLIRQAPEAKHIFTHLEWHMSGWLAELPPAAEGYMKRASGKKERREAGKEATGKESPVPGPQPQGKEQPDFTWVTPETLRTRYALPAAWKVYLRFLLEREDSEKEEGEGTASDERGISQRA